MPVYNLPPQSPYSQHNTRPLEKNVIEEYFVKHPTGMPQNCQFIKSK